MAVSPLKRKATADEGSDPDDHDIFLPASRKRARFQSFEDDSDFAVSTPASVADTQLTATAAVTNTPVTENSSVRSGKPRPKRYLCDFSGCNKAYSRPIHLQNHINSHTGARPHVCKTDGCDKSFTKSEHLTRHVRDKHTPHESQTCTYEVYDDVKQTTGPCGKVFPNGDKLKRHVARHEEKEETRCTWEGCGKVFRKQDTLQRHIRKDHLNELPYVCTHDTADGGQCGQEFGTPGMLKRHVEREHEAPKYFCNLCNHPNGIVVEAQTMPANALDAEFLPQTDDMKIEGDEVDSNILCSLTLEETAPTGQQYPSGAVGFTTYSELQHHLKVVHPPTCDQCGKGCKSRKDLAAHIDIHHSAQRNMTNTPAKQIACPYEDCPRAQPGNGFNGKSNMNTHVKNVHKQERKFVCGEFDLLQNAQVEGWDRQGCGMPLVSKATLISHIRTQHLHLVQEPRKCRKAQRAAREQEKAMRIDGAPEHTSLAVSMLTGYGYEERRPVACLIADDGCQMRFVRDYDMCVHMELTHGWNVDDINDEMVGRDVVESGASAEEVDDILRQRLGEDMSYVHQEGDMDMVVDPQLGGFVV